MRLARSAGVLICAPLGAEPPMGNFLGAEMWCDCAEPDEESKETVSAARSRADRIIVEQRFLLP